jgi:hypothetical protein
MSLSLQALPGTHSTQQVWIEHRAMATARIARTLHALNTKQCPLRSNRLAGSTAHVALNRCRLPCVSFLDTCAGALGTWSLTIKLHSVVFAIVCIIQRAAQLKSLIALARGAASLVAGPKRASKHRFEHGKRITAPWSRSTTGGLALLVLLEPLHPELVVYLSLLTVA